MQRAGREACPLSPPFRAGIKSLMDPVSSWRCAQPTETQSLETAPVPDVERRELRVIVAEERPIAIGKRPGSL